MQSGLMEIPFGSQNLLIHTGTYAKQANGSVIATLGGTSVLVAVCMSPKAKEDIDFFPLMVEYQEKSYAAGKIPGGFFKREGRPTTKETLTSRIIDRPIRPLFPEGFYNEVVVTAMCISSDGENDPDTVATLGASLALHISDIPFDGPIGVARVGLDEAGNYILNPTYTQRETSPLELLVVGFKEGVVMIEGEALEVPEDKVVGGLKFAQDHFAEQIEAQNKCREAYGKPKTSVKLFTPHPELKKKIMDLTFGKLNDAYKIADKLERQNAVAVILDGLLADKTQLSAYLLEGQDEVPDAHIKTLFDKVEYEVVRKLVFEQNLRADGRKPDELREITCEVAVLPRTHGSSVFTRGQTQSLAVVTLGDKRDEQLIEGLTGVQYNNYMLHYNFPAFSVGEAKGSRGPGRREIGHGALAAKAIKGVLPTKEVFPYTIRVVSEILESNGSSSMASVCAGCLSLMDAGVPLHNPVAGISIGLLLGEKGDYRLLTDIMGLEDHHGDMDFKIAGSTKGITAIQLDLKIKGVPLAILETGIKQALSARLTILGKMREVIAEPRKELSQYAPQIISTSVPEEKIGEVIGPGGKMIKRIIEDTGCNTIDIDDDGTVFISAPSSEAAQKAKRFIEGFVQMPEVGKIYEGRVTKIMNFGAFCEFLPGKEGLVHVSELSNQYVKDVESVVKVGDRFPVKVIEIDKMKRINLSKKQAETEQQPVQSS